jgi:hypothetical protein
VKNGSSRLRNLALWPLAVAVLRRASAAVLAIGTDRFSGERERALAALRQRRELATRQGGRSQDVLRDAFAAVQPLNPPKTQSAKAPVGVDGI